MEKEIVKAKKVDMIYKYIVNVLNGSLIKTEMIEVQEGLYISPCALLTDSKNTWDKCIEISVEDIDGSKLVSCKYQLSNFFKGIGDMLSNGEEWLINLSNEIYDNFIYEEKHLQILKFNILWKRKIWNRL